MRFIIYALLAPDSSLWRQYEVDTGAPVAGPVVGAAGEDLPEDPGEYMVAVPGVVSFCLRARPAGLTIRKLRVEGPGAVSILARVNALAAAPEWLPVQSDYAVFQGDRRAAAALTTVHLPLTAHIPTAADSGVVAVDRLVTAVGQSIHRANGRLARLGGEGGTALAASVTLRVGVGEFAVAGSDRVMLGLLRRGERANHHLEITMTTVPGGDSSDPSAR